MSTFTTVPGSLFAYLLLPIFTLFKSLIDVFPQNVGCYVYMHGISAGNNIDV